MTNLFGRFSATIFVSTAISISCAIANPLQMVTPEEAALPPAKGATPMNARGVTRGPKIEVLMPQTSHGISHLMVKFQSFGGATVDISSVRLTYLRGTNVDLTDRLKPYVNTSGIDVPEVAIPPGDHQFRVDLKDSDGRQGTTLFALKVAP